MRVFLTRDEVWRILQCSDRYIAAYVRTRTYVQEMASTIVTLGVE